jgi:hypothetical protein
MNFWQRIARRQLQQKKIKISAGDALPSLRHARLTASENSIKKNGWPSARQPFGWRKAGGSLRHASLSAGEKKAWYRSQASEKPKDERTATATAQSQTQTAQAKTKPNPN